MEEDRPNPDELLKAVTHEEKSARRGQLKIFLGMAAGVGKTYAMLEFAHKLQNEGRGVVVGIVNTHGRKETEALVHGLTVLPLIRLEYKGSTFEELDLEKILALKPDTVLIDELAHSNIPGTRHPKRWQDVEEILDNGINVITTLNVQHIESLKEVIETISGITIRETVPDSILENAAYIEMIDLTPQELLERLKEGKVYLGDQAEIARVHFFQEDRLTALREIALRFAAEKVDHDLRGMVSTIERANDWKPRERLLVAVSHSPLSQKLIRTSRRLAFQLNAPWIAVHVDTGLELEPEDAQMLTKNLALARDLGAEVVSTQDPDVVTAIERIARQKQVTQIIVGRSPSKPIFGLWKRKSIVDRLATECSDLDIHVIRQAASERVYKEKKPRKSSQRSGSEVPYIQIFWWVVLLTALNLFLDPYVGYKIVGFVFLIGISLLSLFYTKGPVFFGAILYGVVWDYFFIPPVGSFVITNNEDTVLLLLYMLTAIMTGSLTDRGRKNRELLIKREETAHALYEIVRLIAISPTSREIVEAVKLQLESVLDGTVKFIIKRQGNGLQFDAEANPKEQATAAWVFENGKEAGWSTDTLAASSNLYIPLKGYNEIVGVLTYRSLYNEPLSFQERTFLYSASQQLAYYLERRFTEEQERENELLAQAERIYDQMLESLAIGKTTPFNLDSAFQARIAPQHLESVNIKNIIEELVEEAQKNYPDAILQLTITTHLPKMKLDRSRIELLLHNLLTHACETAPRHLPIQITAFSSSNTVVLTIEHPGVSSDKDIWGIAVAKVIARDHKGTLTQEIMHPHRTKFTLSLPVQA